MFKIGVIGGGQLAGLLAAEVNQQGDRCYSLDPDPQSPAVRMGAISVIGDRHSAADIAKLAALVDVVTLDLEDVNVDALADLESQGVSVIPGSATLRSLTNKLVQKQTLVKAGIPTSPFVEFDGDDLSVFSTFGWPAVQKAATGGYDGRGVAIINSPADLDKRLGSPGFIEQFVPDVVELSVMVARTHDGSLCVWDPVEMQFDKRGNLLAYLLAPARISDAVADLARKFAGETIEAFAGVGIFGVEMFLTTGGELLINEVAPRTHNSGHYTLDACVTSQFRQQYNILKGQKLTETTQQKPAIMFNVLGEPGYEGDTVVEGLQSLVEYDGVHPYLYGKETCFPLRKMGHVTVTADSLEAAIETGNTMKSMIVVRGKKRT